MRWARQHLRVLSGDKHENPEECQQGPRKNNDNNCKSQLHGTSSVPGSECFMDTGKFNLHKTPVQSVLLTTSVLQMRRLVHTEVK